MAESYNYQCDIMYQKNEKEQQFHAQMTADAARILKKHNVTAILTNSALLGIYRDGNLISWCMGTLFSTFCDQIKPKAEIIIKDFREAGFKISKYWRGKNFKIRIKKGKFNVEIVGYLKDSKYYYRQLSNKKKIIPRKFLDPPYQKIKFGKFKFIAPNDIEGLLKFLYGDWQTPIKSISPEAYKTKNHMLKL